MEGTDLPIGILFGTDHYHKFFTGKTVHSEVWTAASETVIGWVLSGPVPNSPLSNSLDTTNIWCFVEEPRDSNDILRQELTRPKPKTRVAPLKQLTIPRLEILGCLLLSRLVKDVMVALKDRVSVENMVFWSDSQVS